MSSPELIIEQTKEWIQKAVIGLNLCPFAKPVYTQNLIRYVVSAAQTEEELLQDLGSELQLLSETPADEIDTTMLIHPKMLNDFLDYNDFLDLADGLLGELKMDGIIQIANFHPQFQFAGTEPDDITNFTNRAPYPILHLLREESVTKAVDGYPDADSISDKNIALLKRLGLAGWKKLGIPSGGSSLH